MSRNHKRITRKHNDEHREKLDIEDAGEIKRRTSIRNALNKASLSKVNYMLYGTTLLGVAVFGGSALVYQIGDGDIQLVTEDGVRSLVDADKFLGVETYSLAHDMSWNYAKRRFKKRKCKKIIWYGFARNKFVYRYC